MLFSYPGSPFPMQFFRYVYMLKFHKYLFSFWTSWRWFLEYPVTQIWIFHLNKHLECDSHTPRYIFSYCRLLQSYWTTWPTVLYFFTFWTSYRCLLSSWIFWSPDMDLVTPWNYSKIVTLVTHTHTHTINQIIWLSLFRTFKCNFPKCF